MRRFSRLGRSSGTTAITRFTTGSTSSTLQADATNATRPPKRSIAPLSTICAACFAFPMSSNTTTGVAPAFDDLPQNAKSAFRVWAVALWPRPDSINATPPLRSTIALSSVVFPMPTSPTTMMRSPTLAPACNLSRQSPVRPAVSMAAI